MKENMTMQEIIEYLKTEDAFGYRHVVSHHIDITKDEQITLMEQGRPTGRWTDIEVAAFAIYRMLNHDGVRKGIQIKLQNGEKKVKSSLTFSTDTVLGMVYMKESFTENFKTKVKTPKPVLCSGCTLVVRRDENSETGFEIETAFPSLTKEQAEALNHNLDLYKGKKNIVQESKNKIHNKFFSKSIEKEKPVEKPVSQDVVNIDDDVIKATEAIKAQER